MKAGSLRLRRFFFDLESSRGFALCTRDANSRIVDKGRGFVMQLEAHLTARRWWTSEHPPSLPPLKSLQGSLSSGTCTSASVAGVLSTCSTATRCTQIQCGADWCRPSRYPRAGFTHLKLLLQLFVFLVGERLDDGEELSAALGTSVLVLRPAKDALEAERVTLGKPNASTSRWQHDTGG